MANIGIRKQITFDLCQEALKKYYPHSLTQAYYDIRRFMESHGFEHRQSSAYVSLDKMTTLDVVSLAEQLAMALPWLSRCVNEIDVANIGVQHSLKKVLENASRPLSVELEALPLEAAAPRPTHSGHLHSGKRHYAKVRCPLWNTEQFLYRFPLRKYVGADIMREKGGTAHGASVCIAAIRHRPSVLLSVRAGY